MAKLLIGECWEARHSVGIVWSMPSGRLRLWALCKRGTTLLDPFNPVSRRNRLGIRQHLAKSGGSFRPEQPSQPRRWNSAVLVSQVMAARALASENNLSALGRRGVRVGRQISLLLSFLKGCSCTSCVGAKIRALGSRRSPPALNIAGDIANLIVT